jgi:hypothetical protein
MSGTGLLPEGQRQEGGYQALLFIKIVDSHGFTSYTQKGKKTQRNQHPGLFPTRSNKQRSLTWPPLPIIVKYDRKVEKIQLI